MIWNNVEIHNCDELVSITGHDGLLVQRVPESLRKQINPGAQERVRNPDCVEIRFVTSGDSVSVTLSAEGAPTKVLPFWGDFPAADSIEIGAEAQAIELVYPERLSSLPRSQQGTSRFDRTVWRLQFTGRGSNLYVHSIAGESLRPPPAELSPGKTLLTYGTSITHGSAATLAHLCYAYQTARRLGMDLINVGVGGSCHAENAFADYIADRADWDVCLLALSVNMIGAGFTADEFRSRVRYMIERIAGARVAESSRARSVFCITVYPHIRDLVPGFTMEGDMASTEDFREILAEEAANFDGNNVFLIPGPDVLHDPAGLTADLVHPSDYGMTMMSIELDKRIREALSSR